MTEPTKPNPMRRKAAAAALAVLIAMPCEGLRRVAYYDPPGILTVCFGDTHDIVKNKVYSIAECRARLDTRMLEAVSTVDRCAPGLPENVLAAFADTTYNAGPTIACDTKNSTAARYLHAGKLLDACNQIPRWNKARVAGVMVELPGLTKRRGLARDLCVKGLA